MLHKCYSKVFTVKTTRPNYILKIKITIFKHSYMFCQISKSKIMEKQL